MPDSKTTTKTAKQSAADVLARIDVLAAAIGTLAARDASFLTRFERVHGAEAAAEAARALGLDSRRRQAQAEQRTVISNSNTYRYGSTFDPDNDDPETLKLLQSGASMTLVNMARQAALDRHQRSFRPVGPPGSYPDDGQPQAPQQRSLVSARPEAQIHADTLPDIDPLPARCKPVSAPPLQPADPHRS